MPEYATSSAPSSLGSLRSSLLRLLRVPPEPRPPFGASGVIQTFRASPRFYYYRIARWAFNQLAALTGLISAFVFVRYAPSLDIPARILTVIKFFEALAWIGFIVQLPVTFALVKLDYELRWYIVTDRSLRIREGILNVVEKTMTYANIQNLSIRQNPLQRILRIHDLEVKTAGGGAANQADSYGTKTGEDLHTAYFRGVDNAAEIRALILDRVRRHRDAGLGDPDDEYAAPHAADAGLLERSGLEAPEGVPTAEPVASQSGGVDRSSDGVPARATSAPAAALRAAANELLQEARALRQAVAAWRA